MGAWPGDARLSDWLSEVGRGSKLAGAGKNAAGRAAVLVGVLGCAGLRDAPDAEHVHHRRVRARR